MSSLTLSHIEKQFGQTHILHDISISIEKGEFLVLVGPSGCGKSTLMNIIAGLEPPTSGQVKLGNRDITEVQPAERNVSMVFQSYALYPNMTVRDNIAFPLEMRKIPKLERIAKVNEVAKLLQIEHLLDRKPKQLSGGQRQRVAIGRALVREPELYLFDEPLSNLDAQLRVDMRIEIKKLHQRLNASIVYVTHDQIEAMTLATRIAVMKGGVLQQLGTPYEVYNEPANTFVASFMGSPRMNLIESTIIEMNQALHISVTPLASAESSAMVHPEAVVFKIPENRISPVLKSYIGKPILAGIRAEAIILADSNGANRPTSEGSLSNDNLINQTTVHENNPKAKDSMFEFTGRVEMLETTGADTFGIVLINGQPLSVRLEPNVDLKIGQTARFTLDLSNLVCFDPQSTSKI
ncbi:ABC transporter ATP-binding protein [Thorsellia anophelis]|uniref:Carbohydrate ABC transporter ATP-binding protein, CUT1 family (TC 3.A.1.1.-) n=1 Tax=Thorsellia anophelis DSM 18579 TaxID=1123402 RepID=A0A1H9ZWT7_9GAMM|nr:ABC transporter ATP-binding protein [Thorsellia anophelis]SES86215.1 carbohydrate ABC transporter ATP-binding protein, CUT1 family (TC 3.A.1.1.-) [Thorsellia anophelis DSM 18579]